MEHTMASKRLTKQHPGGFDLASRYQRETAVVSITDPIDGTDTGLRIEIGSPQSAEAQTAREAFRSTLTIADGEVRVDEQDAENSLRAQLVAVTKRWWDVNGSPDGILIGGVVVPCTEDAARDLYTAPRTQWIYRQVLTGYLSVSGFFGASKAA
jgi:hypothetical protein